MSDPKRPTPHRPGEGDDEARRQYREECNSTGSPSQAPTRHRVSRPHCSTCTCRPIRRGRIAVDAGEASRDTAVTVRQIHHERENRRLPCLTLGDRTVRIVVGDLDGLRDPAMPWGGVEWLEDAAHTRDEWDIGGVSLALGVSYATVRGWIHGGALDAWQRVEGGTWHVGADAFAAFLLSCYTEAEVAR